MENKTVEITVRQSSKVVLIAKLINKIIPGFLFLEMKSKGEDILLYVTMMEVL